MKPNLPDSFWKPVAAKRFEEDRNRWKLEGLDGDSAEIYRLTVRHNNHADTRDSIDININNDYTSEHYEAVEGYMSADYTFSNRKGFTALEMTIPGFEKVLNKGRDLIPDWKGWDVIHPNWRVIRAKDMGYLSFGMPLPGTNALFGQGLLFASSGGPRSLIRQCTEQHPNGSLITMGRYTYHEDSMNIESLNFSTKKDGGLGKGSFIIVERLNFPEEMSR